MSVKRLMFLAALLIGLSLDAAESKYANKALNPVKFEEPVSKEKIELFKDGKLNFAIVCDRTKENGEAAKKNYVSKPRRSVSLAAEGIVHAFRATTGLKPVILSPDSPKLKNYKYWIVLGDNEITRKQGLDPSKLERDEFKVFTFDKGIIIAGYDGSSNNFYNALDVGRIRVNGTAYGAFDFCERFLGMRYYYPKMGIYAPKITELVIDPVSYGDKPFIRYHYAYALNPKKVPGKAQLSDFSPAYRNGACTRFFVSHMPNPQTVAKAYPDKIEMLFFRNREGHLYYNPLAHIGNYFDVTNPAFTDFYLDELVKKFYAGDKKVREAWGMHLPNSEYICFGQADTYLNDVTNERSKPYLVKSRASSRTGCLSDLYAHFSIDMANKIKQRFPGKKLAMSAYSSRTLPPVRKFDWPDNLEYKICMGCPVMTKSPAFQKEWKRLHSEWHKSVGRPGGNYCYGVGTFAITKTLEGRYMGEFIKLLGDDLWKEYIFFDAGFDCQFYCSYYPAYRAMWNPDFDVQAALDEHWDLLYGKEAGKYLREFYALLVERWEKGVIPHAVTTYDTAPRDNITPKLLYQAFDLPTIKKMETLLAQAKKSVKKDSIEAERLDFFLAPWKKQITTAKAYHTTVTPVYKVVRLKPDEKIVIDGDASDPAWKRATVWFMKECQGEKFEFKEKPSFRMMWSDKGIYLFFSCLGKPKDNPGEVWRGTDGLELMFSPGLKKDYYIQFAINPHGDLYQGQRDVVEGVGGALKYEGLQMKSKYDEHGWSTEWFIPFAGLKNRKVEPYMVWFGNVIYAQRRTVTAENMHASFSLTMRNNLNMDLWGQFKFMGYED